MVAFVLESSTSDSPLARHDLNTIPSVNEVVEIKGVDYVVLARRWRSGRLGMTVAVTVGAVFETAS